MIHPTEHVAGLNAAQREAVQTLRGPLLVLAGAGTGKTRVITVRMAELIRTGIPADRILSVTFTNKAAREMQERTSALLGKRLKAKPLVSTFHSFCVRVLRQDIDSLDYPKRFTIYDRGDQETAARTSLRDIRVNDNAIKPADLLNMVSRWKMAGVGPADAADYVDNDQEFLAAVAYRKYQQNLRACGAVDFDDLLLLTVRLFEDFPDVLQRHQSRFDHVQIDEYQDTNGVQFQLIRRLVRPHNNLCVVGDDDQSIYGWRGADVEHILGFQSQFSGAKVVRLVENYRCTDRILELANTLVRHNQGRHEKTLIAQKRGGPDVRTFEYKDETTEAESVVREINYLIDELNVQPRDFAILFRTNEQPRPFEQELRRLRLPYVLIGGQSFFERKEIRDMLAYLKAIAFSDDEVSLLRIINRPARGIGNTTVEKLMKRAVQNGTSIWDASADLESQIAPKTLAALTEFRLLLNRFRQTFFERPTELAVVFQELMDVIDYKDEIRKLYKDELTQNARFNTLEIMADMLKQYAQRSSEPSLEDFLEQMALLGRDEETDRDDQAAQNAIKLMTLHAAKGLEFPRVYLVGMEEGLLPHQRSIDAGFDSIPEERRLAYVGITRAMDHLTLTRAISRMKWGKRRPSLPSRFLYEMEHDPHAEDGDAATDAGVEPQECASESE